MTRCSGRRSSTPISACSTTATAGSTGSSSAFSRCPCRTWTAISISRCGFRVSDKSWNVYREGFEGRGYADEGCFGYLMNEIPDFPGSFLLHVDVLFNDGGFRPTIELHSADHPLVAAQQHGVDIAQIERWAALTHRQ